jgi:hypothetical protein
MLRDLRAERLIVWKGKRLTILDLDRLVRLAIFNPDYLHLEHEGNGSKMPANTSQVRGENPD